ncbi:MbnP family protein [Spirosoma aerophilum]
MLDRIIRFSIQNKLISGLFMLSLPLATWLISCTNGSPEPTMGSVKLTFDNVVGNQDLELAKGRYVNAGGEPFSITKLHYFVSNLRFHRADGTEYVVPQDSSYFLVRESDSVSQTLTINQVPTGHYTRVSYLIGVDSLRSTSDISRRKGVLEPGSVANDAMYWDWNSGYIFFKLEGLCPLLTADQSDEKRYQYHVGFFGGYDAKTINNLRTVTLPLGTSGVQVGSQTTVQITILADVLKVFNGAAPLRIVASPNVMVSPLSAIIATNYATMFRFSHQSVQ